MKSTNENNTLLAFIIDLINATRGKKKSDGIIVYEYGKEQIILDEARDILYQIARHYRIPDNQWYISKEANDLWNRISKDDIWKYHYTDEVICECSEPVSNVRFYSGSNKKKFIVDTIHTGMKISFNSVFHDEHMTDVKSIVSELYTLDPLTPENVLKTLNKIHIARILKTEDRDKITNTRGRGTDIEHVKDLYGNKYKIVLLDRIK
ncbi:MAG: hypothetical protein K6F03_10410 [Saccharofermentans sp.]|nr:hypothetical protein [Saccharofermentans sp.]